jgi:hypothetical protein
MVSQISGLVQCSYPLSCCKITTNHTSRLVLYLLASQLCYILAGSATK